MEMIMYWNSTAPLDETHPDPAKVFQSGLKLHHLANTAYPIGHLTTMRPYHVPRAKVQRIARKAWQDVERLGLYVHVPFCEKRCGYCEYTVLEACIDQGLYFNLLQDEFELYRQAVDTQSKTLIGFDIGGGTPTYASLRELEGVVEAARRCFILPEAVTISIETTPKIAALEPEKISGLYQMGIRRISMGVQTVSPRLLQAVGRTATSLAYNQQAAENIRKAGFEKFNVDVMYGFAGQSNRAVEATIRHVISLTPEYITLYRMRYKGTRLAFQAVNVSLEQVTEQYVLAKRLLQEAGYAATPGKNTFSRMPAEAGTSDYLTERVIHGTPYLGLGLGAQSLSQYTLSYNSGAADKRLGHYQRQVQAGLLPLQDLYHLSIEAAMGKMISVSFYFGEVNLQSFERKFGVSLEQAFPQEVAFVLQNGLMEVTERALRLTEEGVRQYNGVIALFYAGAVKEHLIGKAMSQREGEIASAREEHPGFAMTGPEHWLQDAMEMASTREEHPGFVLT
jgi:oxygen-independent coproporphyrinogen-3 oxidase